MKKTITYLLTTVAFILMGFGAIAQGGTSPLVGSTHNYTITPESTSNTLLWSVVEGADGTQYDINSQGVVTTTSVANITWNVAGTYTLQFRETSGSSCITLKQITITVAANTFDVSTSSPLATCNAKDGTVNPTGDATTSITFTVDMTTSSAWSPDWEITFTLTPSAGSSVASVAADAGTLTLNAGTYTLTGLTSTTGTGTVDITMDVTEDAFTVQSTVLTITSAKELSYNTPDIDSDDWLATQTVNALPNTSNITTD